MIIFRKSTSVIPDLCWFLRAGEVIAAPTETAYGLLAEATNSGALNQIVKIKGRESGKPIALIAADIKMVRKYFYLSKNELRLANKFWPGPLTLLLKPRRRFPRAVQSHGLVGVRVPGSVWLRRLISAAKVPLTATSANRAGAATIYSVSAVQRTLGQRGLKYIVSAGKLPLRATSTVALVGGSGLKVLRVGGISQARLSRALGIKI